MRDEHIHKCWNNFHLVLISIQTYEAWEVGVPDTISIFCGVWLDSGLLSENRSLLIGHDVICGGDLIINSLPNLASEMKWY